MDESNIPREDLQDAQRWAEEAAADEEAERYYQEMEDHDQYMAEQEANSRAAEEAYRRMEQGDQPIKTDLF